MEGLSDKGEGRRVKGKEEELKSEEKGKGVRIKGENG